MYNQETKTCQNCKKPFVIEPEDFEFYEKIKVPPPTWCPECRSQRRMTWRNERSLYNRKDAFGNNTISIYSSDKSFTVYQRDYWWSDKWDPMDYGKEYDFSEPFFVQFRKLLEAVPVSGVFSSNVINSPYTNHVGYQKDCYLVFASWECENLYYSNKINKSKDSFDLLVSDQCEFCYWLSDCNGSYKLFFSRNCTGCSDSAFLFNCKNCQNCFGCVGLRNKQYHIFNKPYSKEEYKKRIKDFDMGSFENLKKAEEKHFFYALKFPHRYARLINSPGTVGDNCRNVKNSYFVFDLRENVEDSKYCVNGGFNMKDSYDGYGVGVCELLYEGIDSGIGGGSREKFSVVVYSSHNTDYCFNCENSSNLFGCIGLRNKQYCILNRQYTKEEYEKLVPRIIEHMNTMPYISKSEIRSTKSETNSYNQNSKFKTQEIIYKYGEFFPPELSPFAYNETIAQEYFPLTKEQAIEQGYRWKDQEEKEYTPTISWHDLPDNIKDVSDEIVNEAILCFAWDEDAKKAQEHNCTKVFRIIPQELAFYRKMNLPLPRFCPNSRHFHRIQQRNPLKLWHRQCTCAGVKSNNGVYQNTTEHPHHGKDPCPNEFETSYAPERPEIVYCEQCYQSEVV